MLYAFTLVLSRSDYAAVAKLAKTGRDAGLLTHVDKLVRNIDVELFFSARGAKRVREAYDAEPEAYAASAPKALKRTLLDFVDSLV